MKYFFLYCLLVEPFKVCLLMKVNRLDKAQTESQIKCPQVCDTIKYLNLCSKNFIEKVLSSKSVKT